MKWGYAKRKLGDPEVVIIALKKLMNYQRRQIVRASWKIFEVISNPPNVRSPHKKFKRKFSPSSLAKQRPLNFQVGGDAGGVS